jgi:DNA modification methylase
MVKDQIITENYAIYNGDCMAVLPTLEEKSIDLVVYSPPFAGLYNYSSSENDFSVYYVRMLTTGRRRYSIQMRLDSRTETRRAHDQDR